MKYNKYSKRKNKNFLVSGLEYINYKKFHKKIKITKKKNNSSKICLNLKILFLQILITLIIIVIINQKVDINFLYKKIYLNNYNNKTIIGFDPQLTKELIQKVNKTYEQNEYVNINEVESNIYGGRKWIKNINKAKEINVGVGLDQNYVLRAMLTFASVIDSQNIEKKLRFHIAVVQGFSVENMLKIYFLRDKIRDDVEFNFYNAKRVETELKNFHLKGYGICGKMILPELLKDDVERIIIIDTGDTLVLRDLSELYNWNMEDKIYYGVPDVGINKYGRISKKTLDVYINTGAYLVDVKKAKEDKTYEKIVKNKKAYSKNFISDQDIFNDVSYGKIGYLPVRFGLISPYQTDKLSDSPPFKTYYKFIGKIQNKEKYNFLPKNRDEMNAQAFNPVIIHQWNGKWRYGTGLTIYRRIAQYYIKLAGIWDELCNKKHGYCQKNST